VYKAKLEVRIHDKIWDNWVNLKGGRLADLREERVVINYTKTLRDDDSKFVHSAAEQRK
jgi:hypothetical protein